MKFFMGSIYRKELFALLVGKNNNTTLLAAHHCQDACYFPSSEFNE
jgi:hypothetical protein